MATLVDVIIEKIGQAAGLRCRLVVVAAPYGLYGAGRTHAFHTVHARTGAPLVSLDASEPLLDLMRKQRLQELPRLLQEMVSRVEGDLVLLDGAEILFHPKIKNPVRMLQDLARDKTIVAGWQGCVSDGCTVSAPDGKKHAVRGFLVAGSEDNQ